MYGVAIVDAKLIENPEKFYFGALTFCACRSIPKLLGNGSLTFEIHSQFFKFDIITRLPLMMVVFCAYNLACAFFGQCLEC